MPKPPSNSQDPSEGRQSRRFLHLVSQWEKRGKALHKAQDDLSKALMVPPESPILTAAWEAFTGYTETLAKEIGDEGQWLEWYAWECNLGDSPKVMTFSNGEELLVVGVSDLLDAILTDEDGNRIFND